MSTVPASSASTPPAPLGAPAGSVPMAGPGSTGGAGSRLVIWRHTDVRLNDAVKSALAVRTPRDGDPCAPFRGMTPVERVRYVRSLSVATLFAMEDARRDGVRLPGEMDSALKLGMTPLEARDFPTEGSLYAASLLGRSPFLFADPGTHQVYSADTHGGEPAVIDQAGPSKRLGTGETGALPAIAVTVVLIAAVGVMGLALCYCGQAVAEVIDRKLTEDAVTARMLQTQGAAVDLVTAHKAREREERRDIPYDAGEIRLLEMLRDSQIALANRDHVPLPNPFQGAVKNMGEAAKHAGKAAEEAAGGFGIGTGLAFVGALALYAAMRGHGEGQLAHTNS